MKALASLQLSTLTQTTTSMFKRLLGKIPQQELVQMLVEEEAKLGGQLFPDYDPNYPRVFLRIDDHRWIWREPTSSGYDEVVYYVSPQEVHKIHGGQTTLVTGDELKNLQQAIERYSQKVDRLYATL